MLNSNATTYSVFVQYLHSVYFIVSLVATEQRNSFSIGGRFTETVLFQLTFFNLTRKLRNYQEQKLHLLFVKKCHNFFYLFVCSVLSCLQQRSLFNSTNTFFSLAKHFFFSDIFIFLSMEMREWVFRVASICKEIMPLCKVFEC